MPKITEDREHIQTWYITIISGLIKNNSMTFESNSMLIQLKSSKPDCMELGFIPVWDQYLNHTNCILQSQCLNYIHKNCTKYRQQFQTMPRNKSHLQSTTEVCLCRYNTLQFYILNIYLTENAEK